MPMSDEDDEVGNELTPRPENPEESTSDVRPRRSADGVAGPGAFTNFRSVADQVAKFRVSDYVKLADTVRFSTASVLREQLAAVTQLDTVRKHLAATAVPDGLRRQLAAAVGLDALVDQLTPRMLDTIRDQLRIADAVVPQALLGFEHSATAAITQALAGNTALQTWRTSLLLDDTVRAVVQSQFSSLGIEPMVLDSVRRASQVSVELSEWVTTISAGAEVLRGLSGPPADAYRGYLQDLPGAPTPTQLRVSLRAGHGVAGLLGTELLTGELDEEQLDEASRRVDSGLVLPWQEARSAADAELADVLTRLDPTVPELLAGAWEDVGRRGPAALVKIATCAVEALDRSLRAAAPKNDPAVLGWLSERGGPELIDSNGRATRTGQIRYLLRDRGRDARLVERQVESIAALANDVVGRIQAAKHASNGSVITIRAHLMTVEVVLHQLFLVES